MKKNLLLCSLFAVLALAGCSGDSSGTTEETVTNAPTGEAPLKGDLEVVAFQGGYGIDFYQQAGKEFQEKNPDLKIKVTGDPRVWEQLRPRFVKGDVPDLTFPGWGMDHWVLAEEGQLMELGKALDSKPYEGEGTWRDTFEPGILKLGESGGKQYMLPYYYNVSGWWFDPVLFQKNGWTPPKTWDELLVLCEKIKAKGIAPITFQGQYPYYMLEGMVLPWVNSIGGHKALMDVENLEPGSWNSPAMLQAVTMVKELNDKGYFQKGAIAMSHTESQKEFIQDKAAMIPCGTWLKSEMQNIMPADEKMEFFLPPVVAGGKGDPSAVLINIEPWMVPAQAKNPDAAIALYKYMTSKTKAKQFVEEKGTVTAIKGSEEAKLPDVLVAPAKAVKDSKEVWSNMFGQWYKDLWTEAQNSLTSLLNNELTPQGFCDRMEKAADKARADKNIKKRKIS